MLSNEFESFADLTIELRDQYRTIELAINALAQESHAGPEELDKVTGLLATVKQIEEKVRPFREKYAAAGQPLPQELKPVVDETIDIVTRLVPMITEMERAAISAREQLTPRIHESVRAAKMQNAYARAHKSAD